MFFLLLALTKLWYNYSRDALTWHTLWNANQSPRLLQVLCYQPTEQRRRNIYKQKTTKHVYAKAYQKCEQQKNEDVAFIIYIEAASKYEAEKKEGSNNKQCAVSIVDEVNKKH